MRLVYECADGSRTVASTASTGLLYWFTRQLPPDDRSVPPPYSTAFMPLVYAVVRKKFGEPPVPMPDIPRKLVEGDQGELRLEADNGDLVKDWKLIDAWYEAGKPGVVAYEDACLDLLCWFRDQGDITMMEVDTDADASTLKWLKKLQSKT